MYEYLIFAVVISLMCTILFFNPVLNDALKAGVVNNITSSPQTSMITWQILVLLIAPLFAVILLLPPASRSFKSGLAAKVNMVS